MKVLIADDDPVVRFSLRRLLVREFSAAVTEVRDGVEALDALTRQRFSFMLLDLQMPLMDGAETLSVIRSNAELLNFPVVMMTIVKDEWQVRHLISLGIADYFAKPLKFNRVLERLTRLVRTIGPTSQTPQEVAPGPFGLDAKAPLMLVDADPEYRHFFMSVLSSRFTIVPVDSGAKALRICLDSPPQALFVGGNIGVLGPVALVQKIRSLSRLDGMRIIAIAPGSQLAAVRRSAPFDGGVPRTFVPEVFQEHFDQLLGASSPLKKVLAIFPTLRMSLISAAEQALGMMLSIEATVGLDAGGVVADEEEIRASMFIGVPEQKLDLTCRLSMPVQSARILAARLAGDGVEAVADSDALAVVSEIGNVITGRLQKGLSDRGVRATCTLPLAERASTPASRASYTSEEIRLPFTTDCGATFSVDFLADRSTAAA